ncbi:MAG TPA: DUF3558 family protein [Candidatus Acidoferrales bacterium]|nr:DUF3558 family protein [Candidatus Acidoferrales bacterium]
MKLCGPFSDWFRTIAFTITLLALLGSVACNQSNKTASNSSSSTPSATSTTSSANASSSGELDACKLVTKAEAEEVLGEKVKDAESGPASMRGGSICMYESPDSMSARHVTVRVESPNFDWNRYKEDKRVEGEKMQPKRGYIRPVSGLGKEAYFARHVLHVLTDHGILTVIVFKDTADAIAGEQTETKAEAAEKALAQKAVERM